MYKKKKEVIYLNIFRLEVVIKMELEKSINVNAVQINQESETKKIYPFSRIKVFIIGICYGLCLFYLAHLKSQEGLSSIYLIFYLMIGYTYMIANQAGIAFILRNSLKLFKGKTSFGLLFNAVGDNIIPFGLFSLLINYYYQFSNLNSKGAAAVVVAIIASLALFFYFLVKVIRLLEDFSLMKSIVCVLISHIFIISFIYLFL